jgi:hypothetical protein
MKEEVSNVQVTARKPLKPITEQYGGLDVLADTIDAYLLDRYNDDKSITKIELRVIAKITRRSTNRAAVQSEYDDFEGSTFIRDLTPEGIEAWNQAIIASVLKS